MKGRQENTRQKEELRSRALHRAASGVRLEPLEQRRFLAASPTPNIQVTDDADVQQQPSVIVDQHDPQHVTVAYMDRSLVNSGYAGIGVSVSNDGGKTWSKSAVPLPSGFEGATNPIAKFDDQGRLFVSYMAATFKGKRPPITNPAGADADGAQLRTYGFESDNGVFVARSDDGGVTWAAPVAVSTHLYDGQTTVPFDIMPDLAIDTNPASPNFGKMYVVYSRYYQPGGFPNEPNSTGGSQLMISVSSDGGRTFVAKPAINDSLNSGTGPPAGLGIANWIHVTTGPQGFVYVAYYDFGNFIVLHSEDAGATFDVVTAESIERRDHVAFNNDGGSAAPPAGGNLLGLRGFRTQVVRSIVADPVRPGTLYVAEPIGFYDDHGFEIDAADSMFARSTDHGLHWETMNVAGALRPINDDNFQQQPTGNRSDVINNQFYTKLAIDPASGNLVAIWYDNRRDPRREKIDVFGAVSADGGQSFGANFRLTETPIDVSAGKFTDAIGVDNYYFGDFIGLNATNGTAYAAWTGTSAGNQDVFFSSFSIIDPPAPDNDRFEPNDAASVATPLDSILQQFVPKLHMGAGDVDTFTFQSRGTGTLGILARQQRSGDRLRLELLDANGVVVARGTAATNKFGGVVGQRIAYSAKAMQQFTLRVTAANDTNTGYSLDIQALTADLGTLAHRSVGGMVTTGDQNYYQFAAAATGSVRVQLDAADDVQGKLVLEILDRDTLEVLATGTSRGVATLAVTKGQTLLARVSGPTGGTGSYVLSLTNLDAFATADRTSLSFPAGHGPSEVRSGDVNNDGRTDLVVSNAHSPTVSILLGNGNGTFQAPRQFGTGSFGAQALGPLMPAFGRGLALGDFNRDGNLDIVATNWASADVSVLLGRGDGTFQPERRFNATNHPFHVDVGDLNNDGILDLAVIDTSAQIQLATLLGRGDGTFRHESVTLTGLENAFGDINENVKIADFNNDGNPDLLYTGSLNFQSYVRLGTGDGIHFGEPIVLQAGGPGVAVADLNRDGNLDIVNATFYTNMASYNFGNGDGTFSPAIEFFGGQSPADVAVADMASLNPDGSLGLPDGVLDIIVAGSGTPQTAFQGPPEITISPGILAQDGSLSYGDGVHVVGGTLPISMALGDYDGNGTPDIAYVDDDGVQLIFDHQPDIAANDTRATARDLGVVVHLLQQTLTIVPQRPDAWYTLTVPTEAARGSGDEVIDIAALFERETGGGLQMEVLDDAGNVVAAGKHVRIVAKQGQTLAVHVFGRIGSDGARGSGAYTLNIDVLPQVVSLAGHALLPSDQPGRTGPVSSLVLTFQGDRLEQASAEDPSNYTVTWLGPDGSFGTRDDRTFTPDAGDAQAAVYNPSANVDISTGREYPTAVRQTVTLLFSEPLPKGSYRVDLAPAIGTSAFNESEANSIGKGAHPVVQVNGNGTISAGAHIVGTDVVQATGALGDLSIFESGTPFLSQLHDDLGAILDQTLSAQGDQIAVTQQLLQQMLSRLKPSLGGATSLLALFLDPVGIDLSDPSGGRVTYDLDSGNLGNQIANAFVSVAGNVELVVIPTVEGQYTLNVDDVPATARGGAVLLGTNAAVEIVSMTQGLREGQRTFTIDGRSAPPPPPPDPTSEQPLRRPIPDDPVPLPGSTTVLPAAAIASRSETSNSPTNSSAATATFSDDPFVEEHLGGGQTTSTLPEAGDDLGLLLRKLAGQLRYFLGRLMSNGTGGASAGGLRTQAAPAGDPIADPEAAPAAVPAAAPQTGDSGETNKSQRAETVGPVSDASTVSETTSQPPAPQATAGVDTVHLCAVVPLLATRILERRGGRDRFTHGQRTRRSRAGRLL